MFRSTLLTIAASAIWLASIATAHPGSFNKREHMEALANAHAVADVNARALEACQNQPEFIANKERAIVRRAATFERLRKEKGLTDDCK